MVRRVGFGSPSDRAQEEKEDQERAKRIAERLAADKRAAATRTKPKTNRPDKNSVALGALSKGPKVLMFVFLSVWLVGWTIGIIFAFDTFSSSGEWFTRIFLSVWLLFAIIGWFVVVGVLLRILFGKSR